MRRRKRFIIILLAIFTVLLAAFVLWRVIGGKKSAETAVAVQVMKTEGTVTVTNSSARELTVMENMRLYNGYFVSTGEESYAWVNLDDTKLAKLDAVSRMELRKDGKKLQILVHEGAFFFNVTEPLEAEENLDISTGTMVAGIRGTSGWIRKIDSTNIELCILEGKTQCTVTNPVTGEKETGAVSSGEIAKFWWDEEEGACGIDIREAKQEDIPGFALKELAGDTGLQEKIFSLSGMDFKELTDEKARIRQEEDQADTALRLEQIAAEGSGIPVISKNPVWEAWPDGTDGETGEQKTEPETEKIAELVTEPQTEPITEKTTEPETEPVTEKTTEPKTEPVTEKTTEPVTEKSTEPATEKPATEKPTEPVTEPKSYTVTYMLDGLQVGEVETYKYGETVSVRDKAVKEGYTVTDWSRTGSFTMPAENIVITATAAINTYTVTFDANGGTLTGSRTVTADYNTTVALPEPAKAGYNFLGWFTEAENGTRFTADTAVTKGYMLYAHWTAAEAKIMFDANGGSGGPTGITGVTDELISDMFPTDEPTRDGYVFAGWYADKDGSGEAISAYPAVFTAGTATYYARWNYIAGDFIVAGGTPETDYSYSGTDKLLTILTGTSVSISGSTTEDAIAIANGVEANVTLSDVSIDLSSASDRPSPFAIPDGAGATITLEGNNILTSGSGSSALEKQGTDGSLTIRGSGSLEATGAGAGIGAKDGSTGNITIESGTIKAVGSGAGAGIGGGYLGNGSNIKILGGNVTAVGGDGAAGIGGGSNTDGGDGSDPYGRGVNIMISGGVVTAIGGSYGGAGIGGGLYGGWGVDISITGGVVIAAGGSNAAGIGGGANQGYNTAKGGNGEGISITGGIVKSTAGGRASCIGGGFGTGQNGESNNVTLTGGIIFQDTSGQVYGEVILDSNLEIKTGETLHIPSGSKLIISDGVTLTNNGTITYEAVAQEDAVSGNLVNNGTINGSGQAQGISEAVETATRQIMLQARRLRSNTLKVQADLTDKEEAA